MKTLLTFALMGALAAGQVFESTSVNKVSHQARPATTAAWTSATGVNTTLALSVANMSVASASFNGTSTMTAGVITFEVSDDAGTTWHARQAHRSDSATSELTYTLSVTSQLWRIDVAGFTDVRVRLSTVISGTGTATIRLQASAVPMPGPQSGVWTVQPGNTPNTTAWKVDGSAATQPISGTVTANAGSGTLAVDPTDEAARVLGRAFIRNPGDTANMGDATTPVRVDPTGTTTQPVSIATAYEVLPVTTASTTNTALTSYLTSAATTNSTSVKGSAGNVYGIRALNTTATLSYLRMYNSSAAPTCSSATGFVETIPIPSSTTGAGWIIIQPFGQGYTTGIGFCWTGGGSSTDNTATVTGQYLTILYK